MMRLLLPFLLLAACSSGPKVPEDVLPPHKMEAILWDLIQADGVMANPVPGDSTAVLQLKRTQWYSRVLQTHQVGQKAFARSLRFYETQPRMMKDLLASLSEKKAAVPSFAPDTARKVGPKKKVPRDLLIR